ncbi:hypothetical protein M0802_006301 [Mischocyttarus mexicanus]|nr:hypothetical protein M0802_006301 [Mischocyttarus mexicanus]
MLSISTFALVHDYYDDDRTITIYTNKSYRHDERSFGISVGLTTIAVVILVIDLLLLIIKTRRNGSNRSRGGGVTQRQQQTNRSVEADD